MKSSLDINWPSFMAPTFPEIAICDALRDLLPFVPFKKR